MRIVANEKDRLLFLRDHPPIPTLSENPPSSFALIRSIRGCRSNQLQVSEALRFSEFPASSRRGVMSFGTISNWRIILPQNHSAILLLIRGNPLDPPNPRSLIPATP
jgi:hypothetical protein